MNANAVFEKIVTDFDTPLIDRLKSYAGKYPHALLAVFDPCLVAYFSRYHAYIDTQLVCLIIHKACVTLVVDPIRRRAARQKAAGYLPDGLEVLVCGADVMRDGCTILQSAIHWCLLNSEQFKNYHLASKAFLKDPSSGNHDFSKISIGCDLKYARGQHVFSLQKSLPGAQTPNITEALDLCKLVLDAYYVEKQIIAAELAQVAVSTALHRILAGFRMDRAGLAAETALRTYQQEYFPNVDLAGIPSRDGVNTNGISITIISGTDVQYQKSDPRPVTKGEPYSIFAIVAVDGIYCEFSYTAGEGMSEEQDAALKIAKEMHERVDETRPIGGLFCDAFENEKAYVENKGFRFTDNRAGHVINQPFHSCGSVKSSNKTKFYPGASTTLEPVIVKGPDGNSVRTAMALTYVGCNDGQYPLNTYDFNDPPKETKPLKIGTSTFAGPDLYRSTKWGASAEIMVAIAEIHFVHNML